MYKYFCTTYSLFLMFTFFSFAMKASYSDAGCDSENSARVCVSTTKCSRPSDPETVSEEEEDMDSEVVHKNQPVLMLVYKNPETEEENLCVAVTLHGGVSDVEFSLVGSGPVSKTANISSA
jgi:hypothetical protein